MLTNAAKYSVSRTTARAGGGRAGNTRRLWLPLVIVACLGMPVLRGQDAPLRTDQPSGEVQAPFSTLDVDGRTAAESDLLWQRSLAASAVQGGLYRVAERIYQRILDRPDLSVGERDDNILGLVNALIGDGRGEAAAAALESYAGERGPEWQLRRAIAHYLVATSTSEVSEEQRRAEFAAMGELLRTLHPEYFGRNVSWLYFLRAEARDRAGDSGEAVALFEQALGVAASSAERAMFRLARYQASLGTDEISEALAARLRGSVEENQGRHIGFIHGLQYAIVLDRLGRKPEAIVFLKLQKEALPAIETELSDKTLLVLGLVAGLGSEDGRQAYRDLLEHGSDPDFQRVALIKLAASVRPPAGGGSGADLLANINRLLALPVPHPLTEDLLYFRAELSLRNRSFESAEQDAQALLTRFPGSTLKRNALALLASSSWQRPPRYRTAAAYVAQIRSDPETTAAERASLSVLLGECYFQAGQAAGTAEDYRNAAEAYAGAVVDGAVPPGVSPGTIFFQRVNSLILGGSSDAAVGLLDDPEARAGVDVESWWEAEWNLARHLQLAHRNDEALRRVDALGPGVGVPPELRLRFLWLSAQLALEAGRAEETAERVARVQDFIQSPQGAGIDGRLRADVASNANLLAAQARLRGGDRDGGMQAIEKLRIDFKDTRAADYSYVVQAHYLADENRLVDAQQLLISLADNNPTSLYAPVALYEAALLADRRGQEEHLQEANRLLDRLALNYNTSDLVFSARLKQADVLRKLNRFADAEQAYRRLESDYPNHAERALVQISLADTLMAQASTDSAKFEGAVSRLERLLAGENIPADLRAEAGVKLAAGWQTQGNPERAAEIYWEIYRRLIGDERTAAQLGATGPYWLSRALLALGQLEEKEKRYENARMLYETILARDLPGEQIARAFVARIGGSGGAGGAGGG